MKLKRLDRLPKRKVTIDELLDRDDINSAIQYIVDNKDNIEEFVGIYSYDGIMRLCTNGLSVGRVIFIMEALKYNLLREDD